MNSTRLQDILSHCEDNYLLPFYWQHGTHRDRIPTQVQRIYDSGCRALCVESRPHPGFGGPDWWADMDIILAECKKRDMKVWILDDQHFPTGYANGLVAAKYPQHRRLSVVERHVDVMGPMTDAAFLMDMPTDGDTLEGVFAYPRTGYDEDIVPAPVDLTANVRDGYLYWDIPEGCWRIFFITRSYKHSTNRDYMDMLREDSAHVLIEAVYEPHYEHYAEYFGNTLVGFFSDEPNIGNPLAGPWRADYGMYENRVGDAGMAYPMNDELLSLMTAEMGEDAGLYLGELWYHSDHAHKTRLAYMNAVTRLWRRCFSEQIGNWCRDHGVMYIGHIIEDMNAHGRLGCTGGHYFRSLEGQDMSGMDIVLHQVMPGMAHYMHDCCASGGMADPAFFHYVLAQLAASMAHQYPQMKGRAMCEEFGAYGWAEGAPMMKWISDFLLVRGVNHFVPHAFSPDYPDRDCPPHFGAEGHDPQLDGFTHLMHYTNKAAHLLYGGEHITSCAILYHAEGEWMNRRGEAMLMQVPAKALLDEHLCYDIICLDMLEKAIVQNGKMVVNGESYGALVVPYAPIMPPKLVSLVKKLSGEGLPILLCEDRPAGLCGEVVKVVDLPARIRELGLSDITVEGNVPLLRHYHVKRDGTDIYMFFNESHLPVSTTVTLSDRGTFARLRIIEDSLCRDATADGRVTLSLFPGQSEIFVFGDEASAELPLRPALLEARILSPTYTIELADSEDLTAYKLYKTTDSLVNVTSAHECPHFSGKMRYTFTLDLNAVPEGAALDLGTVGQTARVWVNNRDAGIRITAPYVYPVADLLTVGGNRITVEVANTLVGKDRDGFSYHIAIPPSGLLGPVKLLSAE
ncbi:MAG: glycosyl transferase family 2 [Ruminococcaceae bacterium]|nr:glycosyl transferase family 2 [Oscillospiraceae bacterium]